MPRGQTVTATALCGANEVMSGQLNIPMEPNELNEAVAPVMPIRNILTEMIVNGDARPIPTMEAPSRRQRKEPQWVNKYVPISRDGNVFIKYTEELNDKYMECALVDLNSMKQTIFNANDVLKLRDALNVILGENNG